MKPTFLYKILSKNEWELSQGKETVVLSDADLEFIHLSKEDQLNKIIDKFFQDVSEIVILKIKVDELVGKLVEEVNPQGINKYFHLYEGCIPLKAVLENKMIKR